MRHKRLPFRLRVAKALAGGSAKSFIPSLAMLDNNFEGSGRALKQYYLKEEQLAANVGWCFRANRAIAPHRVGRRIARLVE